MKVQGDTFCLDILNTTLSKKKSTVKLGDCLKTFGPRKLPAFHDNLPVFLVVCIKNI